jgi:hypothetical protein
VHARVMKWLSVAVVCASAAVVTTQAFEAKKHYWVAGFFALALTFNPLLPVFRPAGDSALSLVVFSIVPFVMALVDLRPIPLMSIPSIVDRNPGSRSL